ncbi:aegerolysin family protein [Nocardiopsis kunsanensis]|uniref:Crystal protein ET79 n=1 Tax=Nocardiopsis kunsanensis TaxID=141693 RepID=A0A918XKT2_9ACTN|nr:aegerolysin family protein [Nocardiopsis kunsanensis]GHD36447.1 hypothetical protein GCM10007147_43830 [Nocardiopsis kunsanensis]
MAYRSFCIEVINLTGLDLELTEKSLSHGIWGNNDQDTPPERIPGMSKGIVHAESQGFGTGTEGNVVYRSSHGEFKIYWDNPGVGSNAFGVQVPEGYDKTYSDIHGNNAHVKLNLHPKM